MIPPPQWHVLATPLTFLPECLPMPSGDSSCFPLALGRPSWSDMPGGRNTTVRETIEMKILMVLAALLATLVLTACGGGSPAEETATTVPTMAEGNPTPGATLSPDATDDDMPTDEEIAEMLSNIDPIQVAQEWASGGPGRNTMVDIGRLIKSADGKCDYGTTPELCHGIWQLFLSWTLRISSGVSKGIDKSVVQSGRDFPYIRVGGGQ